MGRVSFCVGKGGCCPEADFREDRSITISDNGRHVPFSKEQADKLADELYERGYGIRKPWHPEESNEG